MRELPNARLRIPLKAGLQRRREEVFWIVVKTKVDVVYPSEMQGTNIKRSV